MFCNLLCTQEWKAKYKLKFLSPAAEPNLLTPTVANIQWIENTGLLLALNIDVNKQHVT